MGPVLQRAISLVQDLNLLACPELARRMNGGGSRRLACVGKGGSAPPPPGKPLFLLTTFVLWVEPLGLSGHQSGHPSQ